MSQLIYEFVGNEDEFEMGEKMLNMDTCYAVALKKLVIGLQPRAGMPLCVRKIGFMRVMDELNTVLADENIMLNAQLFAEITLAFGVEYEVFSLEDIMGMHMHRSIEHDIKYIVTSRENMCDTHKKLDYVKGIQLHCSRIGALCASVYMKIMESHAELIGDEHYKTKYGSNVFGKNDGFTVSECILSGIGFIPESGTNDEEE